MPRVMLLNGPNLNLVHLRDPRLYGGVTLREIEERVSHIFSQAGISLISVQSNEEGEIISHVQSCLGDCHGLIINPGGYTHTSVSLHDALEILTIPIIEVHLSKPSARDDFRSRSLVAPVAWGRIEGFGPLGYELAARALIQRINGI